MKKLFIILGLAAALSFSIITNSFATELLRPPKTPIYIKAVNPGYTVDGKANVGEFIELAKAPGATNSLSLAGFVLSYTNSSGNSTILYEFPEESWMNGESILLRLASSPDSELADIVYSKTLALKAGPLVLSKGETIIDYVCWNNKDGCASEFKTTNPTTLVYEPGSFVHRDEYSPSFTPPASEPSGDAADLPEPEPLEPAETPEPSEPPVDYVDESPAQCVGLKFSEIYTYFVESQSEQFIEFYNTTDAPIELEGCGIKYKSKTFPLTGTVQPESYYVRDLPDFSLTKNPTSENSIELIDADGSSLEQLVYPHGQKKGASYAFVADADSAEFKITYKITPGAENIYQQFKDCEEGKVINPLTGYCVKAVSATLTTQKTCPAGTYLNPLTGRCKKTVINDGAEYALEVDPLDVENNEHTAFVAIAAAVLVITLGVGFTIYEFRFEIKKCIGKAFRQFPRIRRRVTDRR